MDGSHLTLPRFNTIGLAEKVAVNNALLQPLSGYLGGINKAGYWVSRLQDKWKEAFHCQYAVACNSATSGLLAACMAIDVGPGDVVWTTGYSMSATAACAKVLGARIVFIDIETIRFSINMNSFHGDMPKCIIVTNLFGHPAYLSAMRSWCDSNNVIMIEDAAQSPFAMEGKRYAGTIGHLGVFSFNVHKHIQAGEGGVIVSDIHDLILAAQRAINHGELSVTGHDKNQKCRFGLNLRMTEPVAAIACAQLGRAEGIIEGRIELAEELTDMVRDISWIIPPKADVDCKHVYYKWAARITNGKRGQFLLHVNSEGFPLNMGFAPVLPRLFEQDDACPVAERMENEELVHFEVCMWNPKRNQLRQMRNIIRRAADALS